MGSFTVLVQQHGSPTTCLRQCARVHYSYLLENAIKISATIIALSCVGERNGRQKMMMMFFVMAVVQVVWILRNDIDTNFGILLLNYRPHNHKMFMGIFVMTQMTVRHPDDWHPHLRDGATSANRRPSRDVFRGD